MKILHIIPSYLPARHASGPIKPTHYLNKWLVKKGVDVTVYTTNMDASADLDVPLNQEVIIDGVKVYYFSVDFRLWQYSFSLQKYLARTIENFDLIHITSVFLSASALGAYYAKKFNKPYIISPHGSLMERPLQYHFWKKKIYIFLIEKRNLTSAAAVHFVVEQEKEDYLKLGLPLHRTLIIPNSIDPEEFTKKTSQYLFRKKFNIAGDRKIILFLGRLHWIKGLDTLIPAFAEVLKNEPKAMLVLAGPNEADYKKIVLELIKKYQIEKNVIFTGPIFNQEKEAALLESNVFILPSYSEAFSVAVTEAMYFGLPVITTDYVGNSVIISGAGAGFVVKKDINSLSRAVLEILKNPSKAQKMGEQGKKIIETKFVSSVVVEEFLKTYREILRKKNKSQNLEILCVVPSYFPALQFGGPIVSVHNMNKTLAQSGVSITVYTTNVGSRQHIKSNAETIIDEVKIIYFGFSRFFEFLGSTGWQFSWSLKSALKNNIHSFDLIYFPAVWNFPTAIAAHYCRKYDKPYIIAPRGTLYPYTIKKKAWKKWPYYHLITKRDLNKAAAIHYTTIDEREKCHNFLNLKNKSFVVPNGIDLSDFERLPKKEILRNYYPQLKNKKIILFLGRLDRKKGLDILVKAYKQIIKNYSDVHLFIVGEGTGNLKEEIKQWLAKEDLLDCVTFAGFLSNEKRLMAFSGSDVFVLPSYSENFGMAVIEAMACGLPVIITKEVGIASYVQAKEAGLVIEANEKELQKAIIDLISNSKLRNIIIKNGYKLIKNEFSLQQTTARFLEECKKIIDKNNFK